MKGHWVRKSACEIKIQNLDRYLHSRFTPAPPLGVSVIWSLLVATFCLLASAKWETIAYSSLVAFASVFTASYIFQMIFTNKYIWDFFLGILIGSPIVDQVNLKICPSCLIPHLQSLQNCEACHSPLEDIKNYKWRE